MIKDNVLIRNDVYPKHVGCLPDTNERWGRYALRFAKNADDLDRIEKLRFEVFNLEMGEGLESAYATCRDKDEFDADCHHLMVIVRKTGEVVGTYRMQTHAMAQTGRGFYSDTEFRLVSLADMLPESIELGRACVAKPHRNHRVLFLLWRGLADYVSHNAKRYFFGCCSLTSQDPAEAARVASHLEANGYMHAERTVLPVPECAVELPPVTNERNVTELPKLMQLYLDYGARIAGPPAIDRQFKTIDFLALFDVEQIDARIRRMFFD